MSKTWESSQDFFFSRTLNNHDNKANDIKEIYKYLLITKLHWVEIAILINKKGKMICPRSKYNLMANPRAKPAITGARPAFIPLFNVASPVIHQVLLVLSILRDISAFQSLLSECLVKDLL